MAIKKRCIRCIKPLRDDGTCQNPKCSRYTEEKKETTEETDIVTNTEE